jgi:hypothetical protein
MNLRTEIERLRTVIADRDAAMTESDRLEIEQRAELAELRAKDEEQRKLARDLDLDRRLEAAIEANPGVRFKSVAPVGFSDTIIVMYVPEAYKQWRKAISQGAIRADKQRKEFDSEPITREFAIASVYDWNGHTDFDTHTERTEQLRKFLTDNTGPVTPITDAAVVMAGAIAEERKS